MKESKKLKKNTTKKVKGEAPKETRTNENETDD